MSGPGEKKSLFGRLFGRDKPAAEPEQVSAPELGIVSEPVAEAADEVVIDEAQPAEPVVAAPAAEAPVPDAPAKQGWFSRLKAGLTKTSAKLTEGIVGVFTKRKLDGETLEELEDLLIQADLGIETAGRITQALAKGRFDKTVSTEEVRAVLAAEVERIGAG